MPLLWPRVRKINVQRCRRVWRQQILKEIGALDAHTTHVRQPSATPYAIQLAHPPQKTLDTKEVEFRVETGITGQKGGIAAAEFHFQRLFRWKQRHEIKAFHYGRKLVNQIG